jgi:two-component system, NarL family, sensor histidine kinase DegS
MVLVVSALHVSFEAHLFPVELLESLGPAVSHMTVGLYAVPVIYAGFAYGLEGGTLTALWCAALASVNIAIWHRSDFEWLTEVTLILVVVTVGVALSVPVERERRRRREAEGTARQLAMLNGVVQASLEPWGADETARSALDRLVEVLGVKSACLGLWKRGDGRLVLSANHGSDCEVEDHAPSLARAVTPPHGPTVSDEASSQVALDTADLEGVLCVTLTPGAQLTPDEHDFLRAVGSQLAVSVENALLRQQERGLLESYVRHVTDAQEKERRHIARELHDGAAQHLAVLSRGLDAATGNSDPDRQQDLAGLRRLARSTLRELRRFSRDLRPMLLDDLGLIPAVEWLVADLQARTGIVVSLTVTGEARSLPPEMEVALYRITQEALRNVERHSRAARAGVEIHFASRGMSISIDDDGEGFEVPTSFGELASQGKLGVMGMQERTQLLGGSFSLASDSGSRTVVTIDLPDTTTPPATPLSGSDASG